MAPFSSDGGDARTTIGPVPRDLSFSRLAWRFCASTDSVCTCLTPEQRRDMSSCVAIHSCRAGYMIVQVLEVEGIDSGLIKARKHLIVHPFELEFRILEREREREREREHARIQLISKGVTRKCAACEASPVPRRHGTPSARSTRPSSATMAPGRRTHPIPRAARALDRQSRPGSTRCH